MTFGVERRDFRERFRFIDVVPKWLATFAGLAARLDSLSRAA
jgi:hypothetical protein